MSALPHPPMRIARWTPKAALSISRSGLHPGCASFPWHTSALVEVSDSISARALSIAGAATRDQACEPLSRQAHYFCSAPLSLAVRLAGARAFSPRTAVPPPPSMAGTSPDKSQTATARPIPSGAQAPGAPDPEERSASEPMIQPLLTGRGAGAGFRFRGPHSVNGVLTRAGRDGVTGRPG
jgi:hypothetical protein